VKHSDFRNASTSGFMGNLIRIELLDMVHGVYGVNLSDFPSVRENGFTQVRTRYAERLIIH
jgi:hypothetical protein